MQTRAVLFDLDGPLVWQDEPVIEAGLHERIKEVERRLYRETIKRFLQGLEGECR